MTRRAILAIAALALVAGAAGAYFSLSRNQPGADGGVLFPHSGAKPMPELTLQDSSGRSLSLADFRGKTILLNVWATWCAPCREEMPALDRLQGKLGGPQFEVVALSVDQQGLAVARKFFEEVGVKSLALYIDPSAQAAFKINAIGLPVTLLVDRQGREIARHLGAAKWDSPEAISDLRRRIDAQGR